MSGKEGKDWADEMADATINGIVIAMTAVIGLIGAFFVHRARTRSQTDMTQFPVAHDPPRVHATPPSEADIGAFLWLFGGLSLVLASLYFFSMTRYDSVWWLVVTGSAAGGLFGLYHFAKRGSAPLQSSLILIEPPPLPPEMWVYTLTLPRTTLWNAPTAQHFIEQLVLTFPHLLLRIHATHEAVSWQLVDVEQATNPPLMEKFVRTIYPGAEVQAAPLQPRAPDERVYRYVCYYQQTNLFLAPLIEVGSIQQFDPLRGISQTMSALHPGEAVSYTVALGGLAQDAYKVGEQAITQSTIHPLQFVTRQGMADAFDKWASGTDKVEKYVSRDQRVLEEKLRQPLVSAAVLVQVETADIERLGELLVLLDGQMQHFTNSPYNSLQPANRRLDVFGVWLDSEMRVVQSDTSAIVWRWLQGLGEDRPPRLILTPVELAALWHLPNESYAAPRILWGGNNVHVPEAVVRQTQGVTLGQGKYQGAFVPVRLSAADRAAHITVVGKTGTGKSTLLHHLIHQDIAAGAGVGVIDPHGTLVRDLLRGSIPVTREQDVVVLDLGDSAYPAPLNPLRNAQGYTATLRVVSLIERLFAGTENAVRISSYLRAALLALCSQPEPTLRDVARFLMEEVYREAVLDACDDPETQDFWDYQYSASSPQMQRQIAEPILNRLRPFYANPTLYPLLCHPDVLDFRTLLEQRKIILISLGLDSSRVPEQERNLVGALLISQLHAAAVRAPLPDRFYLYIDEVQQFVTTALPEMLSEARKYGLSLVTANQFLGQLQGTTLEAVLGNVGASVVFACSPQDASTLTVYTRPQFGAQELTALDRFQAVVRMQVNGQTQPAFNITTQTPILVTPEAIDREQRLRWQSRQQYTPKTREDVLVWLRERYPRRRMTTPANGGQTDTDSFYE